MLVLVRYVSVLDGEARFLAPRFDILHYVAVWVSARSSPVVRAALVALHLRCLIVQVELPVAMRVARVALTAVVRLPGAARAVRGRGQRRVVRQVLAQKRRTSLRCLGEVRVRIQSVVGP